ncbi:hypothetical protein HPB49_020532 [Dermacentor silvarum]|uniref:Uncharacterized protein n=1 Tax=Dermacentor silvarum TaxID=543639 RepID=A0ACB8D839_DERSI|nr:hypothetical protein HPB49_020532 [Dermacentor silvarum]
MRPTKWKPLPPLPKNDIKIILKPHKGLMLKEYLRTEIPQAIIRATGTIIIGNGPNQRKIKGEDFILRIREGTNIIIVSTPSLEVADVIRRITCIELRGKRHPFNVYVADPEDSYKGVVHGFPAHTESADLEHHLRVRTQGVSTERAGMLGSSNTALLTFSGGTRPKCVYYMGVEMRCTEYRPTIQMCRECMQEGHRSDVCPNLKNICRDCGLENTPPQGHECELKCAVCRAAGHETRQCPNKLIAAKRGKTTRQSRSRERSGQNTKKAPGRWFESTEEEDLYRRRSRSRSPHGSRARRNTPSRDPSSSRASQRSNSPLPKKQQACSVRKKHAISHDHVASLFLLDSIGAIAIASPVIFLCVSHYLQVAKPTGLVVSELQQHFGVANIAVLSCILAAIALIAAAFSRNVVWVSVTLGAFYDSRQPYSVLKASIILLRSPAFYVFLVATVVGEYSLMAFAMTVVDYTIDKGVELNIAAHLVMCGAVGQILGRLFIVPLSDCVPSTRCLLFAGAFVTEALCTAAMPHVFSLPTIVALRMTETAVQGSAIAVRGILLVHYVGLETITTCTGLFGLLLIPVSISSASMIGHFRDSMGSYDGFYRLLAGANIAVATGLFFFFAADWRKTRRRHLSHARKTYPAETAPGCNEALAKPS